VAQVNILKLFQDKQERLALTWVAGSDGADRVLESEIVNSSDKGIIGHLNMIHPNWVQVISNTELEYLRSLDPAALGVAFAHLQASGSFCLILAGVEEVPPELIAYANNTSTPLFRSPQSSVHLMWMVRHYIIKELAESTTRHGVFLDVLGVGVMITGDSGVGKSELALYRISPETLEGRCPPLLRDFLEVRGLGILNIRTMFGETAVRRKKSLKLIVHLHRPSSSELTKMERLPLSASFQEILGIKVSTVSIPVMAGRNLAVLVEAASRNFVLQQRGIDTMQEFISRHEQQMQEE
jgi:HPr kinase/phosphorylase